MIPDTLMSFWSVAKPFVGLVMVVLLFVSFALERFPPVVIALIGAALMLGTGILTPADVLTVFSNPAPITIAGFFILSGALIRTGAVAALASLMIARARERPRRTMAELLGTAMLAPAFINNTPVVMVLIPLVKKLGRTVGIAATRLLIPLSYLAILSGTLTLVGRIDQCADWRLARRTAVPDRHWHHGSRRHPHPPRSRSARHGRSR